MTESPFSDSKIKASLDKIDTSSKPTGAEVEVRVDKEGVEAEGTVNTEHVEAGGVFKRAWNGTMDYYGLVRFKWK